MKRTISNDFTGMIDMQGTGNIDSFFSISNYVVKTIPLNKECRRHNHKMSYTDGSADKDNWIFGYSEDGRSIALLRRNRLRPMISSPVDLGVSSFYAPIIVKSTASNDVDLHTFDAIEFRGGVLDILHTPDLACRISEDSDHIIFPDKSSYTKTYTADINNEIFEVTYSIDISELHLEAGKTPDLRHAICSVLRFNFMTPKSLSEIEKYYSYATNLFQFCCGQLNVGFSIRLYKKNSINIKGQEETITEPILVKYKDGYDDYVNDRLNFTQVMRFTFFGDSLPGLMKILAEEKTHPHLLFLPRRNSEINIIQYTDVGDICVAFDREYRLKAADDSRQEEDIIAFSKELENYICNTKYTEELKNRAKGLIGTLKNPSPKMIISYFYDVFEENVKAIMEHNSYHDWGIAKFYSNKDLKRLISKFVDIRNKAAHSGIIWNSGTEIFAHLKLLIYFCVLRRAGYSAKDSTQMLGWLFGRLF